jgi:Ni2+-binding GTPase involved in maturation of urease and hydrogenase
MKLVIVAGTPGSGKTSVLMHAIKSLKQRDMLPAVVKIDCLGTDDDKMFEKMNIPIRIGLSMDMCPDHFAIYNTDEMIDWAKSQDTDILINETAGLCLRCAPYPDNCLAVCVIDVTTGPNTPLKIGPMLTTADVVVATKGDIVSQAEREVFRERVIEANPNCHIIEANGLSGQGASELAEVITEISDVLHKLTLRHSAPLAICTLCTGEKRMAKRHHMGVLRHIDGFTEYKGE